jgi:hypothetical protein
MKDMILSWTWIENPRFLTAVAVLGLFALFAASFIATEYCRRWWNRRRARNERIQARSVLERIK